VWVQRQTPGHCAAVAAASEAGSSDFDPKPLVKVFAEASGWQEREADIASEMRMESAGCKKRAAADAGAVTRCCNVLIGARIQG